MPVETYYSSSVQSIVNGVKTVDEEFIICGDKGMKIKYYKVRGNNKEKVVITGKDGNYVMKKTVNDNVEESNIDKKGLTAALKLKDLSFAKKYIKESKK